MPHAIATRMSYIWYHADRREQWKTVTHEAIFVVKGSKTGASAEKSQAFKEFNNRQAVPYEHFPFFSGRAASRYSPEGMFVQSFVQIFEELTA